MIVGGDGTVILCQGYGDYKIKYTKAGVFVWRNERGFLRGEKRGEGGEGEEGLRGCGSLKKRRGPMIKLFFPLWDP